MENANQNNRVTAANMLASELTDAAGAIDLMKSHQKKILFARAAAAIEAQRELLDLGNEPISLPTGIVSDLDMMKRESTSLPDALAAQFLRQMADEIRRLAGLISHAV